MSKFISRIMAGILGLGIAVWLIPGVTIKILPDSNFFGIILATKWHIIVLLGFVIGIVNSFVKPLLDAITLPIRIITLGAFGFVVNIVLVWGVDLIFREINIKWFMPIFWTTLVIWGLSIALPALFNKKEKSI